VPRRVKKPTRAEEYQIDLWKLAYRLVAELAVLKHDLRDAPFIAWSELDELAAISVRAVTCATLVTAFCERWPGVDPEPIWDFVDSGAPATWDERPKTLPIMTKGRYSRIDAKDGEHSALLEQLENRLDDAAHWRAVALRARENAGRPPGSGIFEDADHFRSVVGEVIRTIRAGRHRPTERRVAELLSGQSIGHGPVSQLSEWCKAFGLKSWQAFLSTID
jgi:hypothetical protein